MAHKQTNSQGLAKKKGVSIIVQKEDFLRPDLRMNRRSNRDLRKYYEGIPNRLSRYDSALSGTALHMMSFAGDPTISAVRCVGNHNAEKQPAFPRAHHKFVVFCRSIEESNAATAHENTKGSYDPYAVWTGSYNFTYNATFSFENAVVLRDKNIVQAFFKEYAQIAAISEPLNWESRWVEPEWRIGS